MLFLTGTTRRDVDVIFHQAIKAETDGLREELEFVRTLGADLIFACGETEKPEVKKTIDEVRDQWKVLLCDCETISIQSDSW